MAGGKITEEERAFLKYFYSLKTLEEQMEVLRNTTERNQFLVRVTMPIGVKTVPCNTCKHKTPFDPDNPLEDTCKAFPNGDIPKEILHRDEKDWNLPCANGYHWEGKE